VLFQFDVLTDIGNSRTIQQDNVLTIPQLLHDNLTATDNQFYDDANGALFVVADGMGGGPHGEYASFMVVEGIQEYVVKNKILLNSDIYSLINGAIQYANQRILNHLKSHPEDKSMGSTVVIGLLHQDVIHIGWVGDSRCYHVVDHRLFQLTHDHSLVQSLVDEGSITEEEAFDHPRRNIIQQSLGMHEVIPSYERYSVQAEQKLIFCSDGLNSMVRDHEILSICDSDIPITEVVTNLVAAANEAGGHDNISCIGVNLFSSPRKQKSNYKPEDSAATKNSTKKRIPIILLLICTVLILSFVFVVRFFIKIKYW
jgi:serine/threonine protein phosphatase PrpC